MRIASILLTAAFSTLLFSCDPCRNLDCMANDYDGHFRIVSATTGTDLVFGPNRIYDKTAIRFYSLSGTDTTFFAYEPIKTNAGNDSILQVRFFPKADVAFLNLGNGDIDTLQISYKTTDTRCCGAITGITNFRYNNAVDIPGDGTHELKK